MTSTPQDDAALREQITDICFNNGGVTKPMVDKLVALITAQKEAWQREARIDEENIHLDKLRNGKWISYATEVTNRINELKKGGE